MLKIKIPGYRPVKASMGKLFMRNNEPMQRRGSVILVADRVNVQPLGELSSADTKLIGVKLVGESLKDYREPLELWTIYRAKEATACTSLIRKLIKKGTKILLAGDLNVNLAPQENLGQTKQNIKDHLENSHEAGTITILNSYNEKTTSGDTIIDWAITTGHWNTSSFTYPVPIELNSYHYPLIIGINLDGVKTKDSFLKTLPRFKRDEKTATKVKQLCIQTSATIESHTSHTLAETILNIWKDVAKHENKKKKKSKNQKHFSVERPLGSIDFLQ